jgi:uncharacterized membrane protein HdeD (DUF308 family)
MPAGRQLHHAATVVLSIALVVIGVAMLVTTVARGGGALSTGVLLGVLFCAAGIARLVLARKTAVERRP